MDACNGFGIKPRHGSGVFRGLLTVVIGCYGIVLEPSPIVVVGRGSAVLELRAFEEAVYVGGQCGLDATGAYELSAAEARAGVRHHGDGGSASGAVDFVYASGVRPEQF